MKVSTQLMAVIALSAACLACVPAFAQDNVEVEDAAPAAVSQDVPGTPDANEAAHAAPMRDPSAADPAPADASMLPVYRAFGELPGLTVLMDDFMKRLIADSRTRPFFENADQVNIKKLLVEQFCVILGGPCTYTGRDMKTTHAGLDIKRGNFNALVEDLQAAMDGRNIPFRAQNKLLAKLAPMHREIEER